MSVNKIELCFFNGKMTYLQIQNTTQFPHIVVNQFNSTIDTLDCEMIIDARNYGMLEAKINDIFEVYNYHARKLPHHFMDTAKFNEYEATLMKQNNKKIIAKMAKEIINIKTPDKCHGLSFNETQKIKLFHFPDNCIHNNKYYATCHSIGGAIHDITSVIYLFIICGVIFGTPFVVMCMILICMYCYDKLYIIYHICKTRR